MPGLGDKIRGLLRREPTIAVHLMIKGRIGEGWLDIDKTVKVPPGTTLGAFVEIADQRGIPLTQALADSPHLKDTLMWNGERAPVADSADRQLGDGDTLYLLAPIAGG